MLRSGEVLVSGWRQAELVPPPWLERVAQLSVAVLTHFLLPLMFCSFPTVTIPFLSHIFINQGIGMFFM